jgi:prophage antirepressor-like protein
MDKELMLFKSNEFGEIRVAEFNGEPIFNLSDLCRILEISNSSRVANEVLDDDLRITYPIIDSLGRNQNAIFVNESGMYQVIFQSRKPEAKTFRKWITSDVLPSIRKNGGYLLSNENDTPETILARAVLVANDTINKQKERLHLLEEESETNKPKVLFADSVSGSETSCLISELAKVLRQNGIDIGQNRLFEWLRDNEYLCKKGDSYNLPTQKSMDIGLFEIKKTSIVKPNKTFIATTTKVTGKGIIYFINKFLKSK